ncbi:hypothetical protein LDL76_13570 [Salegentibacter mishustinae]|uniref:ABC-three component system protein n=1 Tax=Salegentibacter mishustinae TaxID=270918 RepID=UPI001CE06E0B|nr:ABC-three component system protein [Salegentibacter mishustinae]UBZ06382.1 hypothetical protein LDL76_13570 [Salegentibacter mishustinae]
MLEVIHRSDKSKTIVIFIHGFIGGKETWINKDGRGPLIDKLLEEEIISENYDIGIFEYYTKLLEILPRSGRVFKRLLSGKKRRSLAPIEDLSLILGTTVHYTCKPYDDIVLISHSMGGLIAKRLILNEIKENGATKIGLYISLATPHAGSDLANIGSKLLGNIQAENMKPLGQALNKINNEWIQCKTLPERIYVQGSSDDIVPKTSAIGLDREKQKIIYSDDDHFSIIKPANDNDNVLIAVKEELKDFIVKKNNRKKQNKLQFNDIGQYDQEIFVLKLLMADVHNTLISSSKEAFFSAEYAVRQLTAMGIEIEELASLYTKIKELYSIEFGNLLTGKHKDANALVTAVHMQILHTDGTYLKTLHPVLEGLQKYGMLHQLALKDDAIWWARDNNVRTLKEFKETLIINEKHD